MMLIVRHKQRYTYIQDHVENNNDDDAQDEIGKYKSKHCVTLMPCQTNFDTSELAACPFFDHRAFAAD